MFYLLWALIFLLSVIFSLLEISFKSFSKISLAGFLQDLTSERIKKFDFINNYQIVLFTFQAFTILWQLILFIITLTLIKFTFNSSIKIWQTGVILVIHIVFFYFVLYRLGYNYREKILKTLIHFFRIPWTILYPLNLIFPLKEDPKNQSQDDEDNDLSDEEIEIFFDESTKEGVIEHADREMFESVLEFSDTLVKEVMTPRVDMIYLTINAPLNEIIETIKLHKKSRYPVTLDRIDNIEGIILAKDIFDYWQSQEFSLGKIIRKALYVPETMKITELLKEFQRLKQKFAIVVDEFGGISGIVTMEDIMEEIVGEIKDEYDVDSESIIKENDHFIAKGTIDIFELKEKLEIDISENEDFQTLAGLMSYKLGKIPGIGDKINIDHYVFEVIEIDKNRINKVKIYHGQKND